MLNEKIIEELKRMYPEGCRVELVKMDDVQAPSIGTRGTVVGIDGMGSIMVNWDNGSRLNVVYGEDECRKITEIDDTIIEQILDIRDAGLTNMFDINTVQRIAFENNYYELVTFIEEHKKEYVQFIMTGKR